jgi:hypothetical protein
MKITILSLLSICISVVCLGQSSKNTRCTAELKVDPVIQTMEKTHYIFTGSDTTGLNVKVTKIIVSEGRRELVKRRKKDCDSPNPQDCMTQVVEEIPPISMNLYTLPGPDATSEYDTRKEKVNVTVKEATTVTEAIVCPRNRTPKLITLLQQALVKQGYPLTVNGQYDQATQLSVVDYQKSKGIAYGDLTLGVLALLDVR